MINQFLSNNGDRVLSREELRKGEVYYEEFARGYRGFIMPGKERISENGNLRLVGIPVYTVIQLGEGGTMKIMTLDLDSHQFEEDCQGHSIFKPKEGSEIKKTLVEKLPRIV